MSIKKPILVGVGILLLAAFIILAINDVTKKRELRELQEVQIKSKSIQVKEIQLEQDKVEEKLNKAIEDKNASQEEVNKAKEEAEALRIKTQELEAQLQAKLEAKNKLALASTKTINAVTATHTASAASGGSCSDYMRQAGITHPIAHEIVNRENRGCDPCVYNNGTATGGRDCNYQGGNAYGIPQSLPGSKMASHGADWRTNPVTQFRWMQDYVYGRYGSWEAARAQHDRMGWY